MLNITAVVVVYHPDYIQLIALITALKTQVFNIVVVDNGSGDECLIRLKKELTEHCVYISQGFNTGVAAALNKGITLANNHGADYVMLFDQDSLPIDSMIQKMHMAIRSEVTSGNKVAAVGPQYVDDQGVSVSPVTLRGLSLRQIKCNGVELHEVDHLITSGCLISLDAMADIGTMNEDLFIDYVDVEWSLRAKSKGYLLYGVCGALMRHDMGDGVANFFGFKVNVHSSLRNYYMMRNGVWLLKQDWIPIIRRVAEFLKLIKKYFIYSVLIGSCLKNFTMMTKGMWHGVNNVLGKYKP